LLTFALGGIGLVVDRGFFKVQVGFQVFGARWPDGCCLGVDVDRGFLRVDFSSVVSSFSASVVSAFSASVVSSFSASVVSSFSASVVSAFSASVVSGVLVSESTFLSEVKS